MKSLAYASFIIAAVFALLFFAVLQSGESVGTMNYLLFAVPATAGVVLWYLDPRFTSSFATPLRVVAYVAGILVVLIGMAWTALVNEYGAGTNYMVITVGDVGSVFEVTEGTDGTERLVFEGTAAEADQWVADRHAAAQDVTLPSVTIGIGALLTAAAAGLGWHRTGARRHLGTPHSHGHPAT